MPKKAPPTRHPLRLVVLNDSSQVLKMLCGWLQQQGHHCDTGLLADMPNAHEDVPRLILKHPPDVVVYDVGMPYPSSWDLLDVIRAFARASVAAIRDYDSEQTKIGTSCRTDFGD